MTSVFRGFLNVYDSELSSCLRSMVDTYDGCGCVKTHFACALKVKVEVVLPCVGFWSGWSGVGTGWWLPVVQLSSNLLTCVHTTHVLYSTCCLI